MRGLRKAYGATVALDGVDLEIAPGEVLGLLGPNGAGKTTAVECLAGLLEPDDGTMELGDRPLDRATRSRLGIALQADALQDSITPREALGLFARLYGASVDIDAMLEQFGLASRADLRFATLSTGYRQRLTLALALVNDPDLVLLDEPTAGLDPSIRREMRELVRALAARGRAVLLTTHDMGEAETLCDRLAVIDNGRIVATGTPEDLVGSSGRAAVIEGSASVELVSDAPDLAELVIEGTRFRCSTDRPAQVTGALLAQIERQGGEIVSLHVARATLEDVILDLTNRSANPAAGL